MTTLSRLLCLRLGCLALLSLALPACSSAVQGSGGRIAKVKYFHLMEGQPIMSLDPAMIFEGQRLLHGAVTAEEIKERFGHYYSVFWKADDRNAGPVTVKLEYLQARSGLKKRVQEQVVDDIRRSNVSKFQVTGEEYHKSGRVTAWRISVLRGTEELVSQQSALWN